MTGLGRVGTLAVPPGSDRGRGPLRAGGGTARSPSPIKLCPQGARGGADLRPAPRAPGEISAQRPAPPRAPRTPGPRATGLADPFHQGLTVDPAWHPRGHLSAAVPSTPYLAGYAIDADQATEQRPWAMAPERPGLPGRAGELGRSGGGISRGRMRHSWPPLAPSSSIGGFAINISEPSVRHDQHLWLIQARDPEPRAPRRSPSPPAATIAFLWLYCFTVGMRSIQAFRHYGSALCKRLWHGDETTRSLREGGFDSLQPQKRSCRRRDGGGPAAAGGCVATRQPPRAGGAGLWRRRQRGSSPCHLQARSRARDVRVTPRAGRPATATRTRRSRRPRPERRSQAAAPRERHPCRPSGGGGACERLPGRRGGVSPRALRCRSAQQASPSPGSGLLRARRIAARTDPAPGCWSRREPGGEAADDTARGATSLRGRGGGRAAALRPACPRARPPTGVRSGRAAHRSGQPPRIDYDGADRGCSAALWAVSAGTAGGFAWGGPRSPVMSPTCAHGDCDPGLAHRCSAAGNAGGVELLRRVALRGRGQTDEAPTGLFTSGAAPADLPAGHRADWWLSLHEPSLLEIAGSQLPRKFRLNHEISQEENK